MQFHSFLLLNIFGLRYSSKILSFDNTLSILKAKIASFIFLSNETSFDKRKFLQLVVLLLMLLLIFLRIIDLIYCLIVALKTPFASTPGWLKKFLSSADKNEFITKEGIELYGTKILFLMKIHLIIVHR